MMWRDSVAVAVLVILACPAHAQLRGDVVGVLDGDTIDILLDGNASVRIRLENIDAPEKSQPFGMAAKKLLSDKVYRHVVTVFSAGQDRYGRTIGTVIADGQNINRYMVEQGGAWAYRRYLHDTTILELEDAARRGKRGLWGLPGAAPVPPWEWRRN